MSKKYFAKYLPIEGEIKEGDWFLWQDEGTVIPYLFKCIGTDGVHLKVKWGIEVGSYRNGIDRGEINEYGYGDWNKSFAKKVQLFLCSRDIQIGETFILLSNPLGFAPKERVMDRLFEKVIEENPMLSDFIFKVLGPISPKATWVKEGDELDENDLLVLEWGGSSIRMPINMVDFSKLDIGTTYPKILVKGSCGYFH